MRFRKKRVVPLAKRISQKLNERSYVYFMIKECAKIDKKMKAKDRLISTYNPRCMYGNYPYLAKN